MRVLLGELLLHVICDLLLWAVAHEAWCFDVDGQEGSGPLIVQFHELRFLHTLLHQLHSPLGRLVFGIAQSKGGSTDRQAMFPPNFGGIMLGSNMLMGDGEPLTIRSPIDGTTLCELQLATPAQLAPLIRSAGEAFALWRTVPAPRRR